MKPKVDKTFVIKPDFSPMDKLPAAQSVAWERLWAILLAPGLKRKAEAQQEGKTQRGRCA